MVEESRFVWSTVKSVDESATKTNNNISLAAKHINSIHSNGSKSQMSRWPWTICSRSDRMIEVFRIVPVHIWHTQSQSLRGTKYLEENAPLTLNPITLKPLRRIFANFNKWPRLKLPAHYQNFVKIAQGICPCRVIIFQNCFGWVFHTKFNPPPLEQCVAPSWWKSTKQPWVTEVIALCLVIKVFIQYSGVWRYRSRKIKYLHVSSDFVITCCSHHSNFLPSSTCRSDNRQSMH